MTLREIRTIEDEPDRKIGEAEYLDGKPHGLVRVWNSNGVLTQEAEMEFGEYHGKYTTWWDSGKKKEEGRYFRGKKVGNFRWYSEDGVLLQEKDFDQESE